MSATRLHPATEAELAAVWPAARAAHIFRRRSDLVRFHAEAPWRVRIGSKGCAAIVESWRDSLDILAIRGLWCRSYDIPSLLKEIRALAAERGYGRVLSPLLPAEAASLYKRAGLEPYEYLVALRFDSRNSAVLQPDPPEGVRLRQATAEDLVSVFDVDAKCFDPFWAYEIRRFVIALAEERFIVAEKRGRVIGYTLSTVDRGSGTIGRIAVLPEERGRGVGSSLLRDAVGAIARAGAGTISLCTQEKNVQAQALYVRLGGRMMAGRLVLMVGAT